MSGTVQDLLNLAQSKDFVEPYEDVPCPELGEGKVIRVGVMSVTERDALDSVRWRLYGKKDPREDPEGASPFYATQSEIDLGGIRVWTVFLCARDQEGNRLFVDVGHITTLAQSRNPAVEAVIQRLYQAALRVNKSEEDVKKKSSTQNGTSESGLPSQWENGPAKSYEIAQDSIIDSSEPTTDTASQSSSPGD